MKTGDLLFQEIYNQYQIQKEQYIEAVGIIDSELLKAKNNFKHLNYEHITVHPLKEGFASPILSYESVYNLYRFDVYCVERGRFITTKDINEVLSFIIEGFTKTEFTIRLLNNVVIHELKEVAAAKNNNELLKIIKHMEDQRDRQILFKVV